MDRRICSEVFLVQVVLKICSKFTREHPCRNVISIKLQSNFTEITLRHGCSPVNLLHIFRTPCTKKTSGWLLLYGAYWWLFWFMHSTSSPKFSGKSYMFAWIKAFYVDIKYCFCHFVMSEEKTVSCRNM